MKELSEMTLDELWELFPIILKEHNSKYKDWYEIERKSLCERFKENILRINHIGSTAVKDLIAKPTVDILMEISKDADVYKLENELKDMGWILMNSSETPDFRLTFNKGYTKFGFAEKVYHLHIRYIGDYDELYFRDYLIDHEETAREYEKLKLSLWEKFKHDRDGYTDAKREFVLRVSKQAKEEYKDKYLIL